MEKALDSTFPPFDTNVGIEGWMLPISKVICCCAAINLGE